MIYIGQDKKDDSEYLGSGLLLRRAINKYGIQNFRKEIIEKCSNQQELNEREKYWIKYFNATDQKIGYNLTEGGTGGDTFSCQSDDKKQEILEKRQKSVKKYWEVEENRQKASDRLKKVWQRPEHQEHMSQVMMGREITWSDKISQGLKGWPERHPISEETRKLRSEIGKRGKGRVLKEVPEEAKVLIIELYQIMGPKLIEEALQEKNIDITRFIIVQFLKREGIYQKHQKGIGEKSKKVASTSRRGENNYRNKNKNS